MGRIGMPELIIIFFIILLIFGARRLPEIARSIGQALEEFKKGRSQKDEGDAKGGPEEKK